jgi:hypothetical protein
LNYESRKTRNLITNRRTSAPFNEYDEDWTDLRRLPILEVGEMAESGHRFKEAKDLFDAKCLRYATSLIKEGEAATVGISGVKVVAWGYEAKRAGRFGKHDLWGCQLDAWSH